MDAGVDEHYKIAYRLLLDLRSSFEQFEGAGEDPPLALQELISSNLNALGGQVRILEEALPSLQIKRRELWRMYNIA